MRLVFLPLALAVLGSCGTSATPASPKGTGDDGGYQALDCDSIVEHVEHIYHRAAEAEKVAANLLSEFVSANLHMVMVDCKNAPAAVLACLHRVKSARDLEAQCLLPLDDEGTTEAHKFATSSGG